MNLFQFYSTTKKSVTEVSYFLAGAYETQTVALQAEFTLNESQIGNTTFRSGTQVSAFGGFALPGPA